MENDEKLKKEKEKYAEECAKQHKGNQILNMIIAKTFARHSNMTEEEFLKEIGFEGSGKTEDEAIRIAIYNILIEATNTFIQTKNRLKYAKEFLALYLNDGKLTEDEKEGE